MAKSTGVGLRPPHEGLPTVRAPWSLPCSMKGCLPSGRHGLFTHHPCTRCCLPPGRRFTKARRQHEGLPDIQELLLLLTGCTTIARISSPTNARLHCKKRHGPGVVVLPFARGAAGPPGIFLSLVTRTHNEKGCARAPCSPPQLTMYKSDGLPTKEMAADSFRLLPPESDLACLSLCFSRSNVSIAR